MKYSKHSLEQSIIKMMPHIKDQMTDDASGITLPRAIAMFATKYLVESQELDYAPTFEERMATYIIAEGQRDLNEHGMFKFGELEFEFTGVDA